MNPILFHLPFIDVPIRAFGAMVAIGFLVGSHILGKLAERYGDDRENDPERFARITIWVLIGVILGARVMYVIVEVLRESEVGQSFLERPLSMLAFWEGGLVMYGGFFGAVGLGMWSAKREGVRPIHAFDLGVVAGFFALAIGRVGCLLVGDDYGSVVPEGWENVPPPIAIQVPDPLPDAWVNEETGMTVQESLFGAENVGKTLWATQIWMSINALILGTFALWRLRNRRYTGQVALWIVLLYAITRSFIEAFRGDTLRGVWAGGFSTSQIVSIVAGGIALLLLIKNRGRTDDSSPPGRTESAKVTVQHQESNA